LLFYFSLSLQLQDHHYLFLLFPLSATTPSFVFV